jgi:hypothetical protein
MLKRFKIMKVKGAKALLYASSDIATIPKELHKTHVKK